MDIGKSVGTTPKNGVTLRVMVGVMVGVAVEVRLGVDVNVGVDVDVGVNVTVGVDEWVGVALRVDVALRVESGTDVLIGLGGMTRTVGVAGGAWVGGFKAATSLQALRNRLMVTNTKAAACILFIGVPPQGDALIVPVSPGKHPNNLDRNGSNWPVAVFLFAALAGGPPAII
jgi:hypothetical protein